MEKLKEIWEWFLTVKDFVVSKTPISELWFYIIAGMFVTFMLFVLLKLIIKVPLKLLEWILK